MVDRRALVNVGLIALGCSLVLAATHWATRERIQDNQTRAIRATLNALVTDRTTLPDILPDLSSHSGSWRLCDGTVLVRSEAPGYGGPIALLYTIQPTSQQSSQSGIPPATPPGGQTLYRLSLSRHQETPGITDFLREPNGWLAALEGRTASEMRTVNTVSGATITSRALRDHLIVSLEDGTLATIAVSGCER